MTKGDIIVKTVSVDIYVYVISQRMTRCEQCLEWYHDSCMTIASTVFTNENFCLKCHNCELCQYTCML